METVEILYIIVGACSVVVTVTIVWLANDTMKLVRSLRRSSEDVEFMTKEVKEKVLMVSEALDRAGTAASNIISLVEDAIEGIKEKRDQLANSIGLITGVGDYFKKKKSSDDEEEKPMPKIEKKPEPKVEEIVKSEQAEKDKETEKLVEEIVEKPKKEEAKEVKVTEKETKKDEDLENAKPIKKEVAEKK
jgi:outer membrane biosynthesis protein TonB